MVNKKFFVRGREGIIFAFLSPVFSSVATIIANVELHQNTNPLVFLVLTGIVGAGVLLFALYLTGEGVALGRIRSNIKDLLKLLATRGILGNLFFITGLSIASGIQAIFFTKLEPYFVLILSWFSGETKIRLQDAVLLAIHLVGVLMLATGGVFVFSQLQMGDLFIIVGIFLYALSYKYGKRTSRNVGAKVSTAFTVGIGGLVLLPVAIILGSRLSFGLNTFGLTYMLLYVVLWYVFGLSLWFASLKHVKGWVVSALRAIGPVIGAPFAYLAFGQTLDLVQIIGAFIIIITVLLISRRR